MEIKNLLAEGRVIWGKKKMTLAEVIISLGIVYGDLCRLERDKHSAKEKRHGRELRKELGNVIFSTIRWCDDLELDPEECIAKTIPAQKKFKK